MSSFIKVSVMFDKAKEIAQKGVEKVKGGVDVLLGFVLQSPLRETLLGRKKMLGLSAVLGSAAIVAPINETRGAVTDPLATIEVQDTINTIGNYVDFDNGMIMTTGGGGFWLKTNPSTGVTTTTAVAIVAGSQLMKSDYKAMYNPNDNYVKYWNDGLGIYENLLTFGAAPKDVIKMNGDTFAILVANDFFLYDKNTNITDTVGFIPAGLNLIGEVLAYDGSDTIVIAGNDANGDLKVVKYSVSGGTFDTSIPTILKPTIGSSAFQGIGTRSINMDEDGIIRVVYGTSYLSGGIQGEFGIQEFDGSTWINVTPIYNRNAANVGGTIEDGALSYDNVNNVWLFAHQTTDPNNLTVDHATIYGKVTPPGAPVPNNAPTSSNNTITFDEDNVFTFSAANFPFADVDGDTAKAVHIQVLPGNGVLKYSGTPLVAGDSVQITNIGNLTMTPVLNDNGSPYTTFQFQVEDEHGALSLAYTMTINLNAINDIPVIVSSTVQTTAEDTSLIITTGMMTITDVDNVSWAVHSVGSGANYTVLGNQITPNLNFNGTLSVPVTVIDPNSGVSTSHNITITVTAVNDAPVIVSSNSQTTAEETAITITTSMLNITDVDNTSWTIHSIATGLNYTVVSGQVIPDLDFNGILLVPVTVIDNNSGVSNVMNISITVTAVNDIPVIVSSTPQTTAEDTGLPLTSAMFTITDPDNSSHTINSIAPGVNYTVMGNSIIPDADFNGILTVPVTVTDGSGVSNVMNISITVNPVNDVPTIISSTAQTINEDGSLFIQSAMFTITDVDNTSWTMSPIAGANYTVVGNTIFPIANFNGVLTVEVQADDGNATSVSHFMTVNVNPVNDAPELLTPMGSLANAGYGVAYAENILSQDIDGDNVTLSVTSGFLPLGMAIVGDTSIVGSSVDVGIHTFDMTATDPSGAADTLMYEITVLVNGNITPDLLLNGSLPAVAVGTAYSFVFSAIDIDGDLLTYSVVGGVGNLPSGLLGLNGLSDSVLVGSPTTAGTYNFTIEVADGNGGVDSETYSLEVLEAITEIDVPKALFLVGGSDSDTAEVDLSLYGVPSGIDVLVSSEGPNTATLTGSILEYSSSSIVDNTGMVSLEDVSTGAIYNINFTVITALGELAAPNVVVLNSSNNSNSLDFDIPISVSGIPIAMASIDVSYLIEIENFSPQEFDKKDISFVNGQNILNTHFSVQDLVDANFDLSNELNLIYYIKKPDNKLVEYGEVSVSIVTGIESVSTDLGIEIFPNPIFSNLRIVSEEQIEMVQIYDFIGKKVFEETYDSKAVSIDFNDDFEGMYMLIVKNSEGFKKMNVMFGE